MSKRLPYYQSEPAEYLAGDIMFCTFSAQGVFSILRALYWQKDCELNLTQAKKRIKNADKEFEELIEEGIIKLDNDNISISFLDEQFNKATKKSSLNSENGKKGAEARWRKNSESIATPLKNDSESIALREDKIRENKIREDNKINILCVSFIPFFNDVDFQEVWIDFEKVRIRKKASKSERTYKSLMKKILEFSGGKKDLAIKIVANSADSGWTDLYGLKEEKINNQKKQSNFSKVVEANKERSWNKNN